MTIAAEPKPQTDLGSRIMFIAGWVLTVLPALLLTMSAVMKFLKPPEVLEGMSKFGYPESVLTGLGIVELAATLLFVFPRTAVLGAILLTGYLGGATATHVRVGDPYFMPIIIGMVVWGALFLRDSRIRTLLPFRP